MLPYKRRYRILSRALNAARCPPPEEEVRAMLDERFEWLLTVRHAGGDRAIIGHATHAYMVPGVPVGCALRVDFESLPMPPSCCALNDGLIPAETATWRPSGTVEVSAFAIRLADHRVGQITSFVLDFNELSEGDHNAMLQDWDEGVDAVACWGTSAEVAWPSPENLAQRVSITTGVIGIEGEEGAASPSSWRLRSLILTFHLSRVVTADASTINLPEPDDTSITARDWWRLLNSVDMPWA